MYVENLDYSYIWYRYLSSCYSKPFSACILLFCFDDNESSNMLKILCLRHFKISCVKVQDLGNSYIKMPVLIIMSFKVVFCGPPPRIPPFCFDDKERKNHVIQSCVQRCLMRRMVWYIELLSTLIWLVLHISQIVNHSIA